MSSQVSVYGSSTNNLKRSDVPALPRGWSKEEVPRSSSVSFSSRKYDIHYISPMGNRVRNKVELGKHLGDHYDLSGFDYQTGRITAGVPQKNINNGSVGVNPASNCAGGSAPKRSKQYDFAKSLKNDASLVPPIRQTASIFKQPVTVYKLQKDHGKVNTDIKSGNSEKPRQLFWEKRLSGLRASYPDEDYEPFALPPNIKAVGPGVKNDIVLASIATVLHLGNGSISGQSISKLPNLEKNPGVYLNPDQPLIGGISVTQEDVDKQEERVDAARRALEEALESLTE